MFCGFINCLKVIIVMKLCCFVRFISVLILFCVFMFLSSSVAFAVEKVGSVNSAASNGNPLLNMFPFLIVVVLFYFLMIRPQQKKFKEQSDMIAALKVGDEVSTTSGIICKIADLNGDASYVICEIDKGVKVKISRSTIIGVVKDSK